MTVEHYRTVGDTLTPLGAHLKQRGTSGSYEDVDLTDATVKFSMVSLDGTVVVDEGTVGVTVVTAAEGKVQYTFQDADVDEAGTFYAWFTVYEDGKKDTFPIGGRTLRIVIDTLG